MEARGYTRKVLMSCAKLMLPSKSQNQFCKSQPMTCRRNFLNAMQGLAASVTGIQSNQLITSISLDRIN